MVIKLNLKNSFTEKIESARATVSLLDNQTKVVGQTTNWVIGDWGPGIGQGATFDLVVERVERWGACKVQTMG